MVTRQKVQHWKDMAIKYRSVRQIALNCIQKIRGLATLAYVNNDTVMSNHCADVADETEKFLGL